MAFTKNPAPLAAGRVWNMVVASLSTPHFISEIALRLNQNLAAVTLSIALQHGTPAAAIRAAVTRESDGSPAGIVGAILDLLATDGER
jgi:hypothetical protein